MKSPLLLIVLAFALAGSTARAAHSKDDHPQVPQTEHKLKVKGGKTVERDKSKPVRKAIEAWYDRNSEAFSKKDVVAIMELRSEDFHTVTPDGKVNTRADMEAYTRRFLG